MTHSFQRISAISDGFWLFPALDDLDGCPDTVQDLSTEQKAALDNALAVVQFDSRGELTKNSLAYLDSIAFLLKSSSQKHYLICWCDSTLPDSIIKDRTLKISEILVKNGVTQNHLHTPDSNAPQCAQFSKADPLPCSLKLFKQLRSTILS